MRNNDKDSLALNSLALIYSNSLIGEINKIYDPFFSLSGIKYAVYHQYISPKEFLHLGTNEKVNNLYLQNCGKGYAFHDAMQSCPMDDFYFFLWPIVTMDHSLSVIYGLSIFYGLTVYFRQKDSLEAWHFATDKDNYSVMNFYINKKNLIKQFILHFKANVDKITNLNQSSVLAIFPENVDLNQANNNSFHQTCTESFGNTLKYCLKMELGWERLSKRELECLFLLAEGKTAKEIGRILNISNRTIESYTINIKRKTGCHARTTLRDLVQYSLKKWM